MLRDDEKSTSIKKPQEKIDFTLKSATSSSELNELVIRAWDYIDNKDRSNTQFTNYKYILISSKDHKILFALVKDQGGHYQFSIQQIEDIENIPTEKSLYTYSFYTLSPAELNRKYQELKQKPRDVILAEINSERFLVTTAWEFLEACGMNKLVELDLPLSSRFFQTKVEPPHDARPRKVSKRCLDSLIDFGSYKYGTAYLHGGGLLSAAKSQELRIIELTVPEETIIYKRNIDVFCTIL